MYTLLGGKCYVTEVNKFDCLIQMTRLQMELTDECDHSVLYQMVKILKKSKKFVYL
jgi:hypothetical protein